MMAAMAAEQERPTTGHDRGYWFARMDAWGAAGRPYREIADWLTGVEGLSAWWAQKLIVEYEQARGVRDPGARRDGTFSAGASRTIGAPAERVVEAFTHPQLRARWLPGIDANVRLTRAARTVRLDLGDGSRLAVQLEPKGAAKTLVAVEQQKIRDADAVAGLRAGWGERLETLRTILERG